MELKHIATRQGRLSSFLQGEMAMSNGLINRLKWKNAILVNGKPEWNNFQISPGDVITAQMEEPAPDYPPEDGHLDILFEDAHILVVDKPSGMLIHPSRVKNDGTLANLVAGYYRRTGQSSAFHPVTRLDRDTFGIVLLAKNAHVHGLLQGAPLQKTYHALVFGGPQRDCGTITAPIARKPLPSLLREVREDGKPSKTEFLVMERLEGFSKLELRPVTGRTHQLRVHCAYSGWPILGDPQYGNRESQKFSDEFSLETQQLCAFSLDFVHPMTGEHLQLHSHMDVKKISRNA